MKRYLATINGYDIYRWTTGKWSIEKEGAIVKTFSGKTSDNTISTWCKEN